ADKLYHLGEYGVLGVLLARAMRHAFPGRRPPALALLAIGCGIVVGASDELFQSTVPGRESTPYDAAADTLGVGLAQWLYWRRGVGRDRNPAGASTCPARPSPDEAPGPAP